jgi:GDP-4-dehydro-6-deoxy-D-mannose reductase
MTGLRVLVTGATGMVGSTVSGSLLAAGHTVFGCARSVPAVSPYSGLVLYPCHLQDAGAVTHMVREVRPDVILHLAAAQAGALSERPVRDLYETNVQGTVHMLEAARTESPAARVIVVGSGAEYGPCDRKEGGWDETAGLAPGSAYAASKAAASLVALAYARTGALDVTVARLFNLLGPARSTASAPAWFARQLAEIELGLREPTVTCGNLDAMRDFLDYRDAARALCMLVERRGSHSLYNICAGQGVTLREVLHRLLEHCRVGPVTVQQQAPSDVTDRLVGDATRFRTETGWAPGISLRTAAGDLLEHWRRQLLHRQPS